MKLFLSLALGVVVSTTALAQPVLDGSRAGDGYTRQATQTVQTQFGDNLSELNAAYAYFEGGNLNLLLTGQVENNFNKLNIFIDSVPGGENQLTADVNNGGSNPDNDGWANSYNGFMFDAGFEADYLIIARNGNAGGDRFDFDFNSVGNTSVVESSLDIFGGSQTGVNASVGASMIGVGYDNSNTAGVLGGTAAANAAAANAVETGLELIIPLSAIGNPNPADIKISAMVNNGGHNFLSNQFLGGLPADTGNLANSAQVNLKDIEGTQHFTAVPEPGSIALALLAGAAGMVGLRRRS